MPRGSPFYVRERDFVDEVYPPAVEADVFDSYEVAHQESSARIVAIEQELDAKVGSDDVDHIRKMTQQAYDELTVKDPRTVYLIIG